LSATNAAVVAGHGARAAHVHLQQIAGLEIDRADIAGGAAAAAIDVPGKAAPVDRQRVALAIGAAGGVACVDDGAARVALAGLKPTANTASSVETRTGRPDKETWLLAYPLCAATMSSSFCLPSGERPRSSSSACSVSSAPWPPR
jgi:hypothetical protein